MNTNELINEIIYYFRYFKMLEIEIEENLIAQDIVCRLENVEFLQNLAEIFQAKMKEKRFKSKRIRKRLRFVLLELENRIYLIGQYGR